MDYYDVTSKGYNELHGEEQLHKLRIIQEHLEISPEDKILDVGCGTGLSSFLSDNIVGIDPSSELIKQASFKTIQGYAENIPFNDNRFDIVICVTAIHNFRDVKKGLSEMKRVGRNCFVFSILKKSPKLKDIKSRIELMFHVEHTVDEHFDLMFFCKAHKT